MKADTFEEFLKKRKGEEEEELEIDWEQKEKQWISSVTEFYRNIKKWLEPFTKEGLLVIREDSWTNIDEDSFGNYDLKKLTIIIGKKDVVTLTPRGKLVVGGYGRIDMRGPQGAISIIHKNGNNWKFKNMVTLIEFEDANEKSFENVIQDLVNG
ncbi:MAG: hypothetical protein ACHQIM_16075 [Sphingobacteriales bacterium]